MITQVSDVNYELGPIRQYRLTYVTNEFCQNWLIHFVWFFALSFNESWKRFSRAIFISLILGKKGQN